MRLLLLVAMLGAIAMAEVVDRLAVSVGEAIITQQQIELHLRAAALLNGEPLQIDVAARRKAAQKLVELTLIRGEIQNNRYPSPGIEQVEAAFLNMLQQRFGGSLEKLRAALSGYGVKESDLRESLRSQLVVVSFIDFRFRPGVQIPEADLKDFYEFDYTPAFQKANPGKAVPSYDAARAVILETMTQERIDNLLDRWLNQTETQVKIRWVESAFSEGKQ